MLPADLPTAWREKAKELRTFGAEVQARTLEWCAADLEQTWRVWELEPLMLEEAAKETGYSYSALQQKVASGEIPNIGERGKPRVCRKDLPRKVPHEPFRLETEEPDIAGEILAAVQ